jgi:hypothetical protein
MKKFKLFAMLACLVACAAIAGPALAGTAYYGGFSDETGVPYWTGTPVGPTLAAQDPAWLIGVDEATEVGSFTLNDGTTTLVIPDDTHGLGWVLTAAWDLPAPNAIPGRDHYFYIGFDPGAINTASARLGTEWKDRDGDSVKEFVIREQALSNYALAAWSEIVIPASSHVHIRQTCIRGGDPVYTGGDAVFEEYRLNYGPWTPFVNVYSINWVPLTPFMMNDLPHYITWKVRGLGGVIDPKITGNLVPNVNTGADHDGDTVLDENDPWPGNAAWSVDSDSDDMADEWEILYFGDLSETAAGNPDGDIFDNLDEFLGGSNPAIADVFTTLGHFGLMALLTALAVVGMAVLVRRRRVTA